MTERDDHLPYPEPDGHASTAGWSGSDTSHERALNEAADGTATARQRAALTVLAHRGADGATWPEIAAALDWHHGQASGALSVLHKAGKVARLAEVRRGRCAVYVLPEHVDDRATSEQGRKGGGQRAAGAREGRQEVADALATDKGQEALRKAISDAYYDARNAGRTMTDAADAAAAAVASLVRGYATTR